AQEKTERRGPKEFGHCHPINFAAYAQAYKKWVEMADVIRRQQKSTNTVWILTPKYMNARDTAKYEFDQELTSVIDGRFHLCTSSVSRFVLDRKVIFSG